MRTGLRSLGVISLAGTKVYNAPGADAPGRYTKKRLLRNQETKFLPPLRVTFRFPRLRLERRKATRWGGFFV